jgi:hypothetical protein
MGVVLATPTACLMVAKPLLRPLVMVRPPQMAKKVWPKPLSKALGVARGGFRVAKTTLLQSVSLADGIIM